MKIDKDILELGNMVFSELLSKTKNKCFFTQKEYESNFGLISKISLLEIDIQQKINNK